MKGILTTIILGAGLTEFGLTGLRHDDSNSYQSAEPVGYEQIVPISAYGPPPGMVVSSNAGIEQDINAGVRQLDSGVRQIPGYAVRVAESVEQHGIAALAYEDPEIKRTGREIGIEVGGGIRHFALALGKDMLASVRGSGLSRN